MILSEILEKTTSDKGIDDKFKHAQLALKHYRIMSEHIKLTIRDLQKQIKEVEDKASSMKLTVNQLCSMANMPNIYSQSDLSSSSVPSVSDITADQFHGRPLATVVEEYLVMRRSASIGPATTREIFEALETGGYVFNTKNEQNSMISLSTSLGKNKKFYRLPNKTWGLKEWYPNAKPSKAKSSADDSETTDEDAQASEDEIEDAQEQRESKGLFDE